MARLLNLVQVAAALLLRVVLAMPSGMATRQSTDRVVTAHFMMGIISDRTSAADYDADMQKAKAAGIDAFALNIGTDSFTETQLNYAYESAANNNMKVFISFDFAYHSTSNPAAIGSMIAAYASKPAQLLVDGKPFASSFIGDGVDSQAIRNAAGREIFWAPNFSPHSGTGLSGVDGAFNWMAWPNNGNNKAPSGGNEFTVSDGDKAYLAALGSKPYMAPVSPWFFTHYGPEVSYSKNWVFPSDLLWFNRWNEILSLAPRFVQIITWNDYGESHYIGPLSSKHRDDGNSKWTNDMPHGGWADMAKPFIAAYKAGASSADAYVTEDKLVYWYRPTLKSLDCDATDTTMGPADNASGNYFNGRPNGYDTLADSVFVVAMLTEAGEVTVSSGGIEQTWTAPKGVSAKAVAMRVGAQAFRLSRSVATVLSDTSLRPVSEVCPCGLYNYNTFVGTVAAGPSDPLGPDGLSAFANGLKVTTCAAQPSLGTAAPAPTPTSTSRSGSGSGSGGTTTPVTTTPATSPPKEVVTLSPGLVCVAGEGKGNYAGLCSFACHYGYCPAGVCTCTAYGTQVTPPDETGTPGVPAAGLGEGYSDLCSYACNHGYCPSGACAYA